MLALLVSVFSLTALAADDDPNMTAYNGQYTYVVDRASIPGSGSTVSIYAVPADSSWTPTYFDTPAAASAVTWTRTSGSTAGITLGSVSAYHIAANQYASCLTVNLSGSMAHGPASFRATNSSGGYVDISVIVTLTSLNDWQYYTTLYTKCQFYVDGNLYQGTANTMNAAGHTDGRSYVTVMDELVKTQNMGLINGFTESYGYVDSITINNIQYSAAGWDGWQCRVYRDSNADGTYELVPISEALGAGDMSVTLLGGNLNLVRWAYGSYGDPALFPATLTA
jgi:hypothetical protein